MKSLSIKDVDIKKSVATILPFSIFFYLANKASQAFRLSDGADISQRIINLGGGFSTAFNYPLPSFHLQDLAVGLVGAVLITLMLHIKKQNAKKFRKGIEYGSARFGTPADIKPYIDPVFEKNVILTQTDVVICRGQIHRCQKNIGITAFVGTWSGAFRVVKIHFSSCN